jgi:hypothetical protein
LELLLAGEVHRRNRQRAFCRGRLSAWLLRPRAQRR